MAGGCSPSSFVKTSHVLKVAHANVNNLGSIWYFKGVMMISFDALFKRFFEFSGEFRFTLIFDKLTISFLFFKMIP